MSFWAPFLEPFGSHFGLIGAPGSSLRLPMASPKAFLGPLFEHRFSIAFFDRFWVPPGSPNPGYGGTAAHPLGVWKKHTFSHRTVESFWENAISANSFFPAPVGEGNY